MASVVVNGDVSGSVTLQAPSAAGSVTVTLPATSGTMAVLPTATGVLTEANGGTGTTTGYYGFKNRIINGAMVIDQRNAGASKTITDTAANTYTLDRWFGYGNVASKFSVEQTITGVAAPVGFTDYLGCTSLSAYSIAAGDQFVIGQSIEGFNAADLGWGTANAKTVTLSFLVYSSLTGTFGGALRNSAANYSYPFSYSIPVANTWTTISVTIAGPTAGTWVGATNGIGINLYFSLGVGSTLSGTAGSWSANTYTSATGATSVVGTNTATFYITGVQLEKGSTATSFDYRPYGTELQLCQRYFYKWLNDSGISSYVTNMQAYNTTSTFGKVLDFPVTMRATPSTAVTSGSFSASNASGGTSIAFTATTIDQPTKNSIAVGGWTGSSGLVAGNISVITIANNAFISASAEL